MSPYNTRSAVRKQVLESYEDENATVSPSATGKGTHIRLMYSSDEEALTLECGPSIDRTMTPDQDEDEQSSTVCSTEIPDERGSPIADDHESSVAERAIMERMLAQLQEQKNAAEERAAARAQEHHDNPQQDPRVMELPNPPGPRLPLGVTGFGRTGTWVAENIWRPTYVSSTNDLPSVREFGEVEGVQDSPPNNITQEVPGRNPGFRGLTPLPSFVNGDGGGR